MHKKAFTPNNTAMLLTDHQVGTMAWTHSSDINLVKRNALQLARIARACRGSSLLHSGPILIRWWSISQSPTEKSARSSYENRND